MTGGVLFQDAANDARHKRQCRTRNSGRRRRHAAPTFWLEQGGELGGGVSSKSPTGRMGWVYQCCATSAMEGMMDIATLRTARTGCCHSVWACAMLHLTHLNPSPSPLSTSRPVRTKTPCSCYTVGSPGQSILEGRVVIPSVYVASRK